MRCATWCARGVRGGCCHTICRRGGQFYEQAARWNQAGCLEAMAHDLRMLLRVLCERASEPSAVILDSRTLQSSPESGARAGYDGYKRRKGSKLRLASLIKF